MKTLQDIVERETFYAFFNLAGKEWTGPQFSNQIKK